MSTGSKRSLAVCPVCNVRVPAATLRYHRSECENTASHLRMRAVHQTPLPGQRPTRAAAIAANEIIELASKQRGRKVDIKKESPKKSKLKSKSSPVKSSVSPSKSSPSKSKSVTVIKEKIKEKLSKQKINNTSPKSKAKGKSSPKSKEKEKVKGKRGRKPKKQVEVEQDEDEDEEEEEEEDDEDEEEEISKDEQEEEKTKKRGSPKKQSPKKRSPSKKKKQYEDEEEEDEEKEFKPISKSKSKVKVKASRQVKTAEETEESEELEVIEFGLANGNGDVESEEEEEEEEDDKSTFSLNGTTTTTTTAKVASSGINTGASVSTCNSSSSSSTKEPVILSHSSGRSSGKMMSGIVMSKESRLKRLSNDGPADSSSKKHKKSKQPPKPVDIKAAKPWDKEKVKRWKIQEAPVFYPTADEFRYPLAYIEKIRPIGEKYGICKIVPPYKAESVMREMDPKNFKFKTKVQSIHQLKTRWSGPSEVFVAQLCSFLEDQGEPMTAFPQYDGRDLDLYQAFVEVNRRGGLWEVTRGNGWQEVLVALKISDQCVKPIQSLKRLYNKYLYAYELAKKKEYQEMVAAQPSKKFPPMVDMIISECIQFGEQIEFDEDEEGEDFGFYEGNIYSLEEFEVLSSKFAKRWFPTENNDPDSVESEFWRIVENGDENVQVHYGSDLDVRTHGSGFERVVNFDGSEETRSDEHWNLNTLPKMQRSVFSHLTEPVSGVTDPMMYIGMLFSSFCWHNEDNYLYSINYLHTGTYKTWYGVSGEQAEIFEKVMRNSLPQLFEKTPNLLYLLITMMSPVALADAGVPVCRTLQGPGEFVITFPQAYHAGFSHGFTVAEAVNFAPPDWLPFGVKSSEHYQEVNRSNVFCLDQLMMMLSTQNPSVELSRYLYPCMQKMRDNELKLREKVQKLGIKPEQVVRDPSQREHIDQVKQCSVCKADCYLSYVHCPQCCEEEDDDNETVVKCLKHVCNCDNAKKTLKINKSAKEIEDTIEIVKKKLSEDKGHHPATRTSNIHKNTGNISTVYKFPTPSSNKTSPTPSFSLIFSKSPKTPTKTPTKTTPSSPPPTLKGTSTPSPSKAIKT